MDPDYKLPETNINSDTSGVPREGRGRRGDGRGRHAGTMVRAAEEAAPRRGRPALWVRELLGELGEEKDDVEYITPATCLDYNEVCLLVW
jgi:hypothetical protein